MQNKATLKFYEAWPWNNKTPVLKKAHVLEFISKWVLSFIAVILDFKNAATVENILELFLEPVMHKEAFLDKP